MKENTPTSDQSGLERAPANIILLGLPGSGKTTLGELMAESNPGLEYVSLGQISRDLPAGDARRDYVDTLYREHNRPVGDPNFFIELARPAIRDVIRAGKGLILDGLPKKPEEIEPLNKLLEEEGVKIDGVVVCEVSPFTALQRVKERGTREGGLDDLYTAINRGEMYWRSIDKFKGKLGGFLGVKIVNVDTENMTPHSALKKANAVLEEIRANEANATVLDIKTSQVKLDDERLDRLVECINEDNKDALKLLSTILLEGHQTPIVEAIVDAKGKKSPYDVAVEKINESSEFNNKQHLASRYASMIVSNVYEPLQNLSSIIREEAQLRSGSEINRQIVGKIFEEVLATKEIIQQYQEKANGIKNADEFISDEIEARGKDDLQSAESFLKESGVLRDGTTLQSLMAMQPRYWNIFTSSALVGSIDGNYQKRVNSMPGSHHSLSVPIDMPRRMLANSIGEYRPFIEAVSTSERSGFDTSLGFLHVVGMDDNGRAFQAEWPLLMQDSRLAMHPNSLLRDMLARGQEIYFNHDFWHNIVPVYAENFNLHHPHAPIAYGGLLPAYAKFGKDLRAEKEEYEIFVARAHAEAQQYRMINDIQYKKSQIEAALTIIEDIPHLKQQLISSDGEEFAKKVSEYFMTVTIGRLLNTFPPDSDDIAPIVNKLNQDTSLAQTVRRVDLLKLLFTQRMVLASKESRLEFMQNLFASDVDESVQQEIIEHLLAKINDATKEPALSDEIINKLGQHDTLVALAMKYVEPDSPYAESGADSLYEALKSIGVDKLISQDEKIDLNGLNLLRWLAIIAPQRNPLKGHMEKVHGKSKIRFGEEMLKPTEIVKRQLDAITQDRDVYEYRKWARDFGQSLALDIYNLLLDDNQEELKSQRRMLDILSKFQGDGDHSRIKVEQGIQALDIMLDDLVGARYELQDDHFQAVTRLSQECSAYSEELREVIEEILKKYRFLQRQESTYQAFADTDYVQSKLHLEDSVMSLLQKDENN